ncbi:MAG: BrnT family toxin, partial [Nitrospirota bacterium]
MKLNFAWDEEKEKSNLKKHRVSFEEATTVFIDPFSMTIPDSDHSVDEQ